MIASQFGLAKAATYNNTTAAKTLETTAFRNLPAPSFGLQV
jgi:hypothetical protein